MLPLYVAGWLCSAAVRGRRRRLRDCATQIDTRLTEFAYNEIGLAFEDWDATVHDYLEGTASLGDLPTQTAVASDAANARIGEVSGSCGDALSDYAAAIESYGERLGSGADTEGYASASQSGQHFLDACKP